MKRRQFLKDAATVTVMFAHGQAWRACAKTLPDVGMDGAFEPWKTWRSTRTGPLALVRAAILSANAFNTQPWLFRVSEFQIELYADTRRNLGAFDPYFRELHLSLGCALENLVLAAGANRYRTTVMLPPGRLDSTVARPAPELVARVGLAAGWTRKDELYESIPHRHTNRAPFQPKRPVPESLRAELTSLAAEAKDARLYLYTSERNRKELVQLVIGSSRMMTDPAVRAGTRPWFRLTKDAWRKSPDGIYAGPGGDAVSSLDQYAALMMTAPLFGLIAVRDRYDRAQTVSAGRLWQRAHLLATARHLAARPANGAVEMIDQERRLQLPPRMTGSLAEFTGDPTWQPTFMFYMGYPTRAAPASARRDVRSVIL